MAGGAAGDGGGPVPSILLGGSSDWPPWLDPVSQERWDHIIERHAPNSASGTPTFSADTDIGNAIFDTIVHGKVGYDGAGGRIHTLVVNRQLVTVAMRPDKDGRMTLFVSTAHPDQQ